MTTTVVLEDGQYSGKVLLPKGSNVSLHVFRPAFLPLPASSPSASSPSASSPSASPSASSSKSKSSSSSSAAAATAAAPLARGVWHAMVLDKTNCFLHLYPFSENSSPSPEIVWSLDLRHVYGVQPDPANPSWFNIHLFFPSWLSPPSSLLNKSLTVTMQTSDAAEATTWTNALLWAILPSLDGLEHTLTSSPPPKRLLLLINPFGGSGEAYARYTKIVAPFFKVAHLSVEVVKTTHAGHASELAGSIPLGKFDMIATMSGDGLLHEVVNGIMGRADWEKALDSLSVGIIPAGSGNAIAATLKCLDVQAACFNLVKGDSRKIDLLTATVDGKVRFMHLSMTYAFVADADYESERFRWAGGTRFAISAVARMLNLRHYKFRLSFLPHANAPEKSRAVSAENGNLELSYSTLEFGQLPSEWEVIEGDFTLVIAMNAPFLSADVCFAPHADLSDGLIDLVFIRKTTTSKMLSLFLKDLETGEPVASHPEIEYRKVRALHLEPLEPRGIIMLDGEKLELAPLKMESHPRMLSFVCPKELSFPMIPFVERKK